MAYPLPLKGESLTKSLTIGIAATVLIVSLLAIVAMYHTVSYMSHKELAHKADKIASYLVGALATPLWDVSTKEIQMTASAVFQDESVAKIVVTDDTGAVIFAREKKDQQKRISRSVSIFRSLGNRQVRIGHVDVSLAQTHYQSINTQLLTYAILIILLILTSIVAVTGLLIRATLRRPLEGLTALANRYASGSYTAEGCMLPYREFQPFGAALTAMAARIEAQIRIARDAESKYRGIFENTLEGIFVASCAGRFLLANPALARILGYASPEELVTGVTDIASQLYVNPADREMIIGQLRAQDDATACELKFYRKDGQEIWGLVRVRLIRDAQGDPLHLEGVLTDITDRKRAEDALQQAYTTLEQKVVEQAAANRQLQDTLAERDVLLKEVHHRVKNNLQIVSSLLALQTEAITDGHARGLFLESHNRIQAMALVH